MEKKYLDLENISNLEYSYDDDSEKESVCEDEGILLVGEDFQNKVFMENFTSKVIEPFKKKSKGKSKGKGKGIGKGIGKDIGKAIDKGKSKDKDKSKGKDKDKGKKQPPPSEITDTIEMKLKTKASEVKDEDLINFLREKLQNARLNILDKKATLDYLTELKTNNTIQSAISNPTEIIVGFIFLLIPFYYYYPRFYQGNWLVIVIGLFGLSFLINSIQKYKKIGDLKIKNALLFKNLEFWLFFISLLFYFIIFVLICKTNHYSLFYISLIVVYLCMSYVLKLIIFIPDKKNKMSNTTLTYQNKTSVSPYSSTIETACKELNRRFNLNIGDTYKLYSYLSFSKEEKNKDQLQNFLCHILQPLVILPLLLLLGYFSNSYISEFTKKQSLPVVGYNDDNFKYIQCQANYIIPDKMNYQEKIMEILEKKCFNQLLQQKMKKVLNQIGRTYLQLYRPLYSYSKVDLHTLNVEINIDEVHKQELIDEIEDKHQKLLVEDEEIIQKNIPIVEDILETFCMEYEKMFTGGDAPILIENYKNHIPGNDSMLDKLHQNSAWIWKILLCIISPFILFGKMLGSSWMMSNYTTGYFRGMNHIIDLFKEDSLIWRYSTIGVDRIQMEKDIDTLPSSSSSTSIFSWIVSILLLFIFIPFITMMNNIVFGLTFTPKYINMIWIALFIGNIVGNIMLNKDGSSLTTFNIGYIIVSILILLAISITMIMKNKKKK